MDALGVISLQWSPYTYGKNNPVRYIDPSGMADKDSKGGNKPDDDMDEGMFGSGQDMFGRDKYDNKSGLYIPSFERGDIDWSNLILNNISRYRPQRMAVGENASQGGVLDGVPNPASWNFTPAGPGGRYQVAGVSGINFTYFYYGENSKGNIEFGFNHAKIKPLYFEYPLIRKTSSGKTYIVPPGAAASFMAASTAAAIEATETAWGGTVPTEGNQEDMYRFFIKTLRISVQAGGGRLTEIPQYGPTPLNRYRTL